MPNTYDSLATFTLSSTATTVDFTGISGSYTDLRLIITARVSGGGTNTMRFNGSTTDYEQVRAWGDGLASNIIETGLTSINLNVAGYQATSTVPLLHVIDILNYARGTGTSGNYKSCIFKSALSDNTTNSSVQYSCATRLITQNINQITIATTGTFQIGSSFALYGILKA